MEMPQLSVLLPTYLRPKILVKTIKLLETNLQYSGKVQYLIGNDGDPLLDDFGALVGDIHSPIIVLNQTTGSLGANLNRLIHFSGDLMLQMDDDHWLIKPINIDKCVEKLYNDPRAGWIKLMGIGAHRYKADLEEIFWRIDWESPEVYIPSNRPHLKRKRFHEYFGYYIEGMKLGQTEENFCHRCIDLSRLNTEPYFVYIPLDLPTESAWDHVGDSWQLRGF